MNNNQNNSIQEYFEEISRKFDSYYLKDADTGGIFGKIIHAIFRRPGMARRFEATFTYLGDIGGKHVLDVGSGSGIYSIEIARRGGSSTGIDITHSMIELAKTNAKKSQVADRCRFLLKDLSQLNPEEEQFDAVIAIGLFDYIPPSKQKAVLDKLLSMTTNDVIATFPRRWVPGAFFRSLYFMTKELNVYFVTSPHIKNLVSPEITDVTFSNCGPIWTVRFRKIL